MSFVFGPCNGHKHPVAKASLRAVKKVRVTPAERKAADKLWKLGARFGTSARLSLTTSLIRFRGKARTEDLVAAFASGSPEKVAQALSWGALTDDLDHLTSMVEEGIATGAAFAAERLPVIVQGEINFSAANPLVRSYVRNHTAALISQVGDETKNAVRDITLRALERALPPRESAKLIRSVVGLSGRYATAVENYQYGLAEQGVNPARAWTLSEAYSERLLDVRASTIARTEQANVLNAGQSLLWDQARDEGVINPKLAEKKWVIDPVTAKECDICLPMDGQVVGLEESFLTGDGDEIEEPTAHPNCNCMVLFIYDGEE